MNDNGCGIITTLIIIFCGSIAAIVCGGVVLNDVEVTKGYTKTTCDASEGHIDTDSSIGHYHGKLSKVWVLNVFDNGTTTRDYQVELYFPPIKHYLLEKRSEGEVKDWSSGLTSANSFTCRVDPDTKEGISTILDISGWIALMFFGCLFLAIFLLGCLYFMLEDCKCCCVPTRNTRTTEMSSPRMFNV
jgi:hypothetical protein